MIQVSSRGYLKAPNRNTWIRWSVMIATMKLEPQPWIARRNQPRYCSWFKYSRLVHASLAAGT